VALQVRLPSGDAHVDVGEADTRYTLLSPFDSLTEAHQRRRVVFRDVDANPRCMAKLADTLAHVDNLLRWHRGPRWRLRLSTPFRNRSPRALRFARGLGRRRGGDALSPGRRDAAVRAGVERCAENRSRGVRGSHRAAGGPLRLQRVAGGGIQGIRLSAQGSSPP